MDLEKLTKIGLTKGESKVYLSLLGLGQTTTGPIVKKAGVTTSKSYKILNRLEEKGLVSHIFIKKIKHFKAASPEKVLEIIKKKEIELKENQKEFELLLPDLLDYQKKVIEEHEAEVYYGMEGLATLFWEQIHMLNKGEESYVIGIAPSERYSEPVSIFFEKLQKQRDNKKIVTNLLYGEDARGTASYQEKSKYCRIKYLPYSSLVSINVYKDITIIGVFVYQPILFKIKSNEIAKNFIDQFKILWRIAKK